MAAAICCSTAQHAGLPGTGRHPHSHGTGCTLSAAITACLARGDSLANAIDKARDYVKQGLRQSLTIGQGQGPICHWVNP